MNAERLDYLSAVSDYKKSRTRDAIGEHSPCGEMGTAERLAREDFAQFTARHGAELTLLQAIAVCEAQSAAACNAQVDEFWRRLAGSLRKSLTMLESE